MLASLMLTLVLHAAAPVPPPAPPARPVAARPAAFAFPPQGEAAAKSPDARWSTEDYAARELAARDLEDFTGGSAGLVLAIVLIVAVVVIVAILVPW